MSELQPYREEFDSTFKFIGSCILLLIPILLKSGICILESSVISNLSEKINSFPIVKHAAKLVLSTDKISKTFPKYKLSITL
jgi:hypothetical protein